MCNNHGGGFFWFCEKIKLKFLGELKVMCDMAVSYRWLPLELEHRGELHKVSQMIQESQGEIDCFV